MQRTLFFGIVAGLALVLLGGRLAGGRAAAQTPPGAAALARGPAAQPALSSVCGTVNVQPSRDPSAAGDFLNAVAALGPTEVWAVGNTYTGGSGVSQTLVEQWNGSTWTVVPSPNAGSSNNGLNAVAVVSASDVWAVGNSYSGGGGVSQTLVEHWNGTTWTSVPSPNVGSGDNVLGGLAAVGPADVWAVGGYFNGSHNQTLAEHWNGTAWAVVPSPNASANANALYKASAVGPNEVWAAGTYANGTNPPQTLVERWNGTAWTIVPSPNSGSANNTLFGLAAVGPNDVWAAGFYYTGSDDQTLVEHWNGTAWTIVPSPNVGSGNNAIDGLAAAGANDIWVAGYYTNGSHLPQTLLAHWDGTAWTVVPSPNVGSSNNQLVAVAAVSPIDIWTVGTHVTAGPHYQTLTEEYTVSSSFSDVQPTDYFYTPVLDLACRGVISGYSDGTFRPFNNTTRSQQVKIVVLGFAKPITTPSGGNYTFADVPSSNPFWAVVETAAAGTIVSGYACGGAGEPCDAAHRPYFRPYANVTRGQLSKITVVAAGWGLLNPATGTFADVAPGSAFYEFVETAAGHGVISGYSCGGAGEPCDPNHRPYFRQYNDAVRGQIAKIVYLSVTSALGPGKALPFNRTAAGARE